MNRGREPAQSGDKDRVSVFALQCFFFLFRLCPPFAAIIFRAYRARPCLHGYLRRYQSVVLFCVYRVARTGPSTNDGLLRTMSLSPLLHVAVDAPP